MKVYTKSGDDGSTSLFSGGRVGKDHPRIEAYGTLDELNSTLGLLMCEPLPDGTAEEIREVQSRLFDLGGALADARGTLALGPEAFDTRVLEQWIDAMSRGLPELKAFILPGGSRPAALAHVARTLCRRAERRVLSLMGEDTPVPEGAVPFLNRLSDYFFVLARFINATMGIEDPQWTAI